MIMKLGIALLGLVVLVNTSHGGNVEMEEEVLQVIRNYESSINDANSVLWRSIWDLDYADLTILENDKPYRLGKPYVEQIALWMKTAKPEKRQTWHTNQVISLGSNLAYTLSLRTEHNMPDAQKESRISMVVRKSDDVWKIIHCHFSFVPGH